jgi:hypothetical protein
MCLKKTQYQNVLHVSVGLDRVSVYKVDYRFYAWHYGREQRFIVTIEDPTGQKAHPFGDAKR